MSRFTIKRTAPDRLEAAGDLTEETLVALESALCGVEEALGEARAVMKTLAKTRTVKWRGVASVSVVASRAAKQVVFARVRPRIVSKRFKRL